MSLLNGISSPADVRKLSIEELTQLAGEIRQAVVQAVTPDGGHLASNLGVAELTLALHYCYDFGPFPAGPDMLLFDVGHQCYPHKMITGRAKQFDRLRKKGSIGGFPNPEESPYDLFAVGHAGTAISTAVGLARAGTHLKDNGHVVAVVGDASIVNGLAFEGLNNAGGGRRLWLASSRRMALALLEHLGPQEPSWEPSFSRTTTSTESPIPSRRSFRSRRSSTSRT